MSAHNICFHGEVRKVSVLFWLNEASYLELWNITPICWFEQSPLRFTNCQISHFFLSIIKSLFGLSDVLSW